MKLFFAILLMCTVVSSEMTNIIHLSSTDELCLLDTSYEGECEKETSENVEETSKVKIMQNVNGMFLSNDNCRHDLSLKWQISTPYLEIHGPPPDLIN